MLAPITKAYHLQSIHMHGYTCMTEIQSKVAEGAIDTVR